MLKPLKLISLTVLYHLTDKNGQRVNRIVDTLIAK